MPDLRYLRWALVAWPALEVVTSVALYAPFGSWVAVVQALILWACYNAIAKGSAPARATLTILAGLQILTGIWQLGLSRSNGVAFALGLIAISLRGAVISLANDKHIRAIQLEPEPSLTTAAFLGDHGHEWLAHARLDGWVVCPTCGKVQAQAGTVALINQKAL